MKQIILPALVGLLIGVAANGASVPRLADSIKTIRAVGPEGKGNAEAGVAWKKLSTAEASALPTILTAMDGANELAINWLRAAVDAIAARELAAGGKLPVPALEKFLRDTKHHPRARRLAYELIERADSARAEILIAAMRDDPSSELRRDAVQRLANEGAALTKAGRSNDAVVPYQTALKFAREADQVEGIAKELKKLAHPVSLPSVFGWVSEWKVIGPFDNTRGKGFEQVFPPERGIDLKAEHDGKNGKVRWQDFAVQGDYGLVDLNKPCGALKEVTGYAYSEFYSDKARPVELRLGCENSWKLWLNGRYLFGRDEYHRMMQIDQYRLPGELKKGRNTILVKVCQNEQVEDWTKGWEFQLRVTDSLGTSIVSAKR
jgi:hypothetical protein